MIFTDLDTPQADLTVLCMGAVFLGAGLAFAVGGWRRPRQPHAWRGKGIDLLLLGLASAALIGTSLDLRRTVASQYAAIWSRPFLYADFSPFSPPSDFDCRPATPSEFVRDVVALNRQIAMRCQWLREFALANDAVVQGEWPELVLPALSSGVEFTPERYAAALPDMVTEGELDILEEYQKQHGILVRLRAEARRIGFVWEFFWAPILASFGVGIAIVRVLFARRFSY